jgi:hypothetical protein
MNHPIINFKDKTYGTTSKRGYLIGNSLVVGIGDLSGKTWKIFKVITGTPLINATFFNLMDAVSFAENVDALYSDFFGLWEIYPDADVFALAKWSVKKGLQFYETVNTIQKAKNPISNVDIIQAQEVAKEKAYEWIGLLS